MKLSKDTVSKRENFVREAVRAEPRVTGDQLQELLAKHFGKKMRIGRLYELKNQALKAIEEQNRGT